MTGCLKSTKPWGLEVNDSRVELLWKDVTPIFNRGLSFGHVNFTSRSNKGK